MNAARIVLVAAGLAAFATHALLQEDRALALITFALPVWLALEACWRLLDPER